MMAKKFVTHTSDAYAYVMLCVCHYDNNRFISFSNFLDTLFFLCFLFHRFFAFILVTFLPVLNWQHFFLLKLIILTLGQLHTNILLLRLLLLLLFFMLYNNGWTFTHLDLFLLSFFSLFSDGVRFWIKTREIGGKSHLHNRLYHALDIEFYTHTTTRSCSSSLFSASTSTYHHHTHTQWLKTFSKWKKKKKAIYKCENSNKTHCGHFGWIFGSNLSFLKNK